MLRNLDKKNLLIFENFYTKDPYVINSVMTIKLKEIFNEAGREEWIVPQYLLYLLCT